MAIASLIVNIALIVLIFENIDPGKTSSSPKMVDLQESALVVVDNVSAGEGSALYYQDATIQRVVRDGLGLKPGDKIVIVFPGDEHPVPPSGWMVEICKRPGFNNQYFRKKWTRAIPSFLIDVMDHPE